MKSSNGILFCFHLHPLPQLFCHLRSKIDPCVLEIILEASKQLVLEKFFVRIWTNTSLVLNFPVSSRWPLAIVNRKTNLVTRSSLGDAKGRSHISVRKRELGTRLQKDLLLLRFALAFLLAIECMIAHQWRVNSFENKDCGSWGKTLIFALNLELQAHNHSVWRGC